MRGKRLGAKERIQKLKDDKSFRREIFRDLCVHLRQGRGIVTFPEISEGVIGECIKTYPDEFVREELDEALREGYRTWEDIGIKQSTGHCIGNSRSWFYNMANKHPTKSVQIHKSRIVT